MLGIIVSCSSLPTTHRAATLFVRATAASSEQHAVAVVDDRRRRQSLYEVLRVKRDASQLEIKTAYRTLAKLHHPDARSRFMGSTVAASMISSLESESDGPDYFVEINRAYATLSDPDTRAMYDTNLLINGVRRRSSKVGDSGRPIRRWETDQCW